MRVLLFIVSCLFFLVNAATIYKRSTGDATFYNTGLGSCGRTNKDSDLIVALSASRMKNGANSNKNPMCGKYITVKYKGKSVRAKVVDTCPSCAYNDVDLSPAAFKKLASFSKGRISVSWNFS